jgi:sugar phosphate permease
MSITIDKVAGVAWDQAAADRASDKAMLHLLPWLLLMYIFAYLDRANLGFAKNAFQADTGISEAAYAFGAGIFSIAYASIEIPSNIMLRRVGARLWLSRIMVTWGIVSASMMFVNSATSFYVVRVLLGVAEAGFFPGAVYFMTQWFPDARRARVMGLFYFGAPLSFVFGGPLSGFLLDADGTLGLHGWQWMFVVEGLLATAIGFVVLATLADSPSQARWLDPTERSALTAAIAAEDRDKALHGVQNLLAGLLNWRVVYLGLIYFLIQICVSGVVYYLPAQVGRLLGRNVGFVVGVVTAIPWACAIVACILVPRLADWSGQRRAVACVTMLACAAGVSLSSSLAGVPVAALAALCIAVAGFISVQPIFWTFPAAYLGGGAAAAGLALVNTIGALAGFVAPNYRLWADTTFGAGAGLYALGLTTLLGAIMIASTAIVFRRTN